MRKDGLWNKMSKGKRKFLHYFLSKKVMEFGLSPKNQEEKPSLSLFLFDIFPFTNNLTTNIALPIELLLQYRILLYSRRHYAIFHTGNSKRGNQPNNSLNP